jgi:hypothetical protein
VMRAVVALALLVSGCEAGLRAPPLMDARLYDFKKPGITCMRGLRFDEQRGCTLDVGRDAPELRLKQRVALSPVLALTSVLYVLDGHVAYLWNKEGDAEPRMEDPLLDVAVPPGEHVLSVLVRLQGHGEGVFAYLNGYRFEVRSSHAFTAPPAVLTEMTVSVYEKGGVTTPLEERPAVRWTEQPLSK